MPEIVQCSLPNLQQEITAYWDGRAATYSNGVRGELGDERGEAWRRVLSRLVAPVFAQARSGSGRPRVLDLGCGPGFFEVLFAQADCMVDGVDASADMLQRARENVAAAALEARVSLHQGDVASLPFPDSSFDVVISRNVTWLMRTPQAAYAEWLRVLRPGGMLLVFDANWYRYLVDADVDVRRHADQDTNMLEGWDEDAQASSDEEKRCEEIALELPLTSKMRPAWDLRVLGELGADAQADETIWRELWTESEQRYYGSSPMFLVKAVK